MRCCGPPTVRGCHSMDVALLVVSSVYLHNRRHFNAVATMARHYGADRTYVVSPVSLAVPGDQRYYASRRELRAQVGRVFLELRGAGVRRMSVYVVGHSHQHFGFKLAYKEYTGFRFLGPLLRALGAAETAVVFDTCYAENLARQVRAPGLVLATSRRGQESVSAGLDPEGLFAATWFAREVAAGGTPARVAERHRGKVYVHVAR